MEMFIAGEWVSKPQVREIRNPFDGSVVDTVPAATREDVAAAIDAAQRAAGVMASMPAHERSALLRRASEILAERQEAIAQLLVREVGKTIREARGEASRPPAIFDYSADAARQVMGEVIPFDAAPGAEGRRGYCKRVPCGIVSAISPFNFPAALSAHKVAPALAAGNAVVLKPASQTPLAVLEMARALDEAGFPAGAVNVVTASGEDAEPMVVDERVRVVSFTGSAGVGREIARKAGIKRVHLELGSSSAVTVMEDADLDKALPRLVTGAFGVAGQVCISVQKILVHEPIYGEFVERYVTLAQGLKVGDPMDESTDVGPMISEAAAERAQEWVKEAVEAGGRVACGGVREGALMWPTVLVDVPWGVRVTCEEVFAPVVVLQRVQDVDEAIRLTNASPYGLQAGIYTSDIATAFRFAEQVEVGGVNINETCWWRVDFQPYGGMKRSGVGREGIKYAIEEMTEWKTVVFNLD